MRIPKLVVKILAAGLLLTGTSAPALAKEGFYCCKINPAICQGMCGQRCCGSVISAGKTSGSSMKEIPTEQLKKEADECRGAEPLIRAIDAEVRSRAAGGAAPSTAPTSPAGGPMPQ